MVAALGFGSASLNRISHRNFGVRELGPAFSTADSSAVCQLPRRVAASKSGDESPHSESFARANRLSGSQDTVLSRNALSSEAEHFPSKIEIRVMEDPPRCIGALRWVGRQVHSQKDGSEFEIDVRPSKAKETIPAAIPNRPSGAAASGKCHCAAIWVGYPACADSSCFSPSASRTLRSDW